MDNLKEKTAKGIAWGAINNGATQVLNLVFGIFLGRLLSTDDYGILALITIFTLLAGCIQAAGFSQALANLKTPTQRDYNAVAWFNILAGCSMYVLLFFCAPLIAWFFDQPLLTDVSRLAFLTIPIRKWQPTPVFLPGESQGRGSLVGCRLWGCTELDTTEAT